MKSGQINIYQTSLEIRTQIWYAPKSSLRVGVIKLSGDINAINNKEKELRKLECIVNRVDQLTYSNFYIIDTRRTTNGSQFFIELFERVYHDGYKPIFLVNESKQTELTQTILFEKNLIDAINYISQKEKKKRNDGGKKLSIYRDDEIRLSEVYTEKRRHRTEVFEINEANFNAMLIELEGELLPGSKDDPDVEYMVQIISDTISIEFPKPLIIDASKLTYTWGDKLSLVPFEAQRDKNYPFRLILKPEQLEPFAYVIDAEKRICSSVEQAIEELKAETVK